MVCSSCGFENQKDLRFCGMCGTPLPYRPLIAPGAQSTLNFTRVPVETGSLARERGTASVLSRAAVLPAEATPVNGGGVSSPRVAASAVEEPIEVTAAEIVAPGELEPALAVEQESADGVEAAAQELVPDVPLDEYIQNFHYEPPADAAEVTMRGDAPVAEQRVAASPMASAEEAESRDLVAADASDADMEAPYDTESRLGLEADAPSEVTAERPRFLDLGEAAAESEPAVSGTSTIVGPSFLGLSDEPQLGGAQIFEGEEPARKIPWRGWAAAGIVVVFAGLGLMEWRSQSHQTDNGPVEVMKTKVRSLTKDSVAQGSSDNAAASLPSDNSKPDMQVQQQAKPQPAATSPQTLAANSSSSSRSPSGSTAAASQPNASTVASAGAQTSPPQKTTPMTAKPAPASPGTSPGQNGSAKSQTTAQAQTTPPRTDRKADATGDDTASVKATPGADELAKAKNASDSAAEAAWLWKSTAKGNPEAPVMLADMYMKGDGVPRSCEQAVVLLKTAAEKENARARNRLASMYSAGDCVQRNRVEAYRWLSSALAANPHSDWALQNRDLIWQQMTPDERAEAEKYR